MKELPIITISGKRYYIDERLRQIREVGNPSNYENLSIELIMFWVEHGVERV